MKAEIAQRRIVSFAKRFGSAHLWLAYHGAFPLALTPDLLYRLWANFQRDVRGNILNIPWIAVSDLLLSSLCEEVGDELYEMDATVRGELLAQLKAEERFGSQRINELSNFLLAYVRQQLHSHELDVRDFAEAQRWTALAYTQPTEAAREVALALKNACYFEETSELVRLASIVETFAEPLVEFEPLLTYARGMVDLALDRLPSRSFERFIQTHRALDIAGVELPIPKPIAQTDLELSVARFRWKGSAQISQPELEAHSEIQEVETQPSGDFAPVDLREFFRASSPGRTLSAENEEDRKFYIDFSSVLGKQLIEELIQNITFFSPDEPTCELFTGHIGCGKSTELRRLAAELEQEGFHVVYFDSSQDLDMGDVDLGDLLLAIARRVSESVEELEDIHLEEPQRLQSLLQNVAQLLLTEIDLSAEAHIPGFGKVSASTDGSFSAEVGVPGLGLSTVAVDIGKITAKAKNSPEVRSKLREYLEPRISYLIDAINEELIEPAKEKLKQYSKQGLVAIVDNLDRIENRPKPWGRNQPEYLFVDRGEQLRQLNCHLVYTMPLSLLSSNEINHLIGRFGVNPKVLPMVPVETRDGREFAEGMALMRQMALARAFPNNSPQERLARIPEIIDRPESLDRLCRISGGHIREFLGFLYRWIRQERQFPLSADELEKVIEDRRNDMSRAVSNDEWELLRQVKQRKKVTGDDAYEVLIRSMFVYEYRDSEGSWFDVNPILAESEQFLSR